MSPSTPRKSLQRIVTDKDGNPSRSPVPPGPPSALASEGLASSTPTSDIELELKEPRRLEFYARYGDYAGSVFYALKDESFRTERRLPDRVVPLDNSLRSDARLGQRGPDTATLEECISRLQLQGYNIDLEMARLAITIYARRNKFCHAKPGNGSVTKGSDDWKAAINKDISKLPRALPERYVTAESDIERMIRFYQKSTERESNVTRDRVEAHLDGRRNPDHAEPSLTGMTKAQRERAFDFGAFTGRAYAISRTTADWKPKTPYPIPGTGDRKRPISDSTSYISKRQRVIGSLSSEGCHHDIADNTGASDPTRSQANLEYQKSLSGFNVDIEALAELSPGLAREILDKVRRDIGEATRKKRAEMERQKEKERKEREKREKRERARMLKEREKENGRRVEADKTRRESRGL